MHQSGPYFLGPRTPARAAEALRSPGSNSREPAGSAHQRLRPHPRTGLALQVRSPSAGAHKQALTCSGVSDPDAAAVPLRVHAGPAGPHRAPARAMKGSFPAQSRSRSGHAHWHTAQQSVEQSTASGHSRRPERFGGHW
ncbi:hypothetical protein NDU88_002300 [Pleurodeles waltl]|uniref:Uncharacterized protein n=1 Tax=Pleurodeles waltl TaxID=8319 RepID=A0AAV7T306_PLEWA|nr:hypothetical protein NDU88_002300 [Pleurodeles waltl]